MEPCFFFNAKKKCVLILNVNKKLDTSVLLHVGSVTMIVLPSWGSL